MSLLVSIRIIDPEPLIVGFMLKVDGQSQVEQVSKAITQDSGVRVN